MFLIKGLITFRYQDGMPLTNHLNTFQGVINQLAGMGIKFDDVVQGLCLLGTLPDSWETFKMSLSNSALEGIISMELAKTSVLNEELRKRSQGTSARSEVLVTENRGRNESRGQESGGKGRSKSRGKMTNVKCFYYHLKGRMKRDCKKWKQEKGNRDQKKGNEAKANDQVVVAVMDDSYLAVYDEETINVACHETSWVIDSGASIHATYRKEFFTTYIPGDFGVVKMDNNCSCKVVGIGDVCLEMTNGIKLVLRNVNHILEMRLNLISTGKLDDEVSITPSVMDSGNLPEVPWS
ncbi:hypothetical protein Dimus_037876 [Dionaea muscipula]